jgi:hypothetical protein
MRYLIVSFFLLFMFISFLLYLPERRVPMYLAVGIYSNIYHRTQSGRAHAYEVKGCKFKSRLRCQNDLQPTYLHLWALCVPGEDPWGRG